MPITEPRMESVCDKVKAVLEFRTPYMIITTDDSICSSVMIRGSFESREDWPNSILHNSRYFMFRIGPKGKERYYKNGSKMTVALFSYGSGLNKFRKYTGTVEKVVEKIEKWFKNNEEKS